MKLDSGVAEQMDNVSEAFDIVETDKFADVSERPKLAFLAKYPDQILLTRFLQFQAVSSRLAES